MRPVRVVSLFAGAGFADYALHRASEETGIPVDVVFACDSWDRAVMVYNANLPSRAVVADVKQLGREDLPAHDLVIGGPPCQPHSLAGKRLGAADPRDCLPDFLRLADGAAYLMENVRPRLVNAPWSEQFCAFDFGDVTTRRRWFYSDHLLHVHPTPGPRRFGHIRDHEADRIAIGKRGPVAGQSRPTQDDEPLGSFTSGKGGVSGFLAVAMRSYPQPYTEIPDDGALGSVTSHTHDQPLRVGLRGHSASASASAFNDDEPLGTIIANAWHANERGKLGPDVRCPSLLEMARAHSIPDSWDWTGVTKTNRGKMIANGWPIGMGTAVLSAMLRAVAATMDAAA